MENSVMDYMSKDHDRLDALFRKYQESRKDPKTAKEYFRKFKRGLQRHIIWEEQILFPLFEDNAGMGDSGPTAVMRMEHLKIGEILEGIHDKVRNLDTSTGELEMELLSVLKPHNDKEEGILYPWIDESVDDKKRAAAFENMRNLPEESFHNCCCGGH